MDGFRKGVPFSMEAARAHCATWLAEHGMQSVERLASMETSRWVSLVLVSRFSSPEVLGHHGELASVLAPEHRALEHDALLPLLFEMSFIRAACKQPAIMGKKPAETPGPDAPSQCLTAAVEATAGEDGADGQAAARSETATGDEAADDAAANDGAANDGAADDGAADDGAADDGAADGLVRSLPATNEESEVIGTPDTGARHSDGVLADWIARVEANESGEEADACAFCGREEEEGNELLYCGVCSCQFHQRCLPVRHQRANH